MNRKEVKAILHDLGIENRFSLRTVNFNWSTGQVLTIKDWYPSPKAKEIEVAFRGSGVIVDFDRAKSVAFASTS